MPSRAELKKRYRRYAYYYATGPQRKTWMRHFEELMNASRAKVRAEVIADSRIDLVWQTAVRYQNAVYM